MSLPCDDTPAATARARTLVLPCFPTTQLPPRVQAPQYPHLSFTAPALPVCFHIDFRDIAPVSVPLVPSPSRSPLCHRTSHSPISFHHSLDSLSIPFVVPTPTLFPFPATFPSTSCALKRFPLTSPRKLALTCVKLAFLRTPGWNSLGGLGEAVMMHCLFLPKIGIFGHQNTGLV